MPDAFRPGLRLSAVRASERTLPARPGNVAGLIVSPRQNNAENDEGEADEGKNNDRGHRHGSLLSYYFTLNFFASPSNTSRSPLISRISSRGRVRSCLDCGMPSTRALPLRTVAHTVGKSFPFRINSVHITARSRTRPSAI